jgi:NADH:ubiquinone oxidoreductase subunit E
MATVTVCVGSSCHLKGAREVIARFSQLVKESGLDSTVELKGSFCMERCGEGVNWQLDEEPLTSASVEEAIRTFRERVILPAKARQAGERGSTSLGRSGEA